MRTSLLIVLLLLGVTVLLLGVNESALFTSGAAGWFQEIPSERSIWLLVGGVILTVIGLYFMLARMR